MSTGSFESGPRPRAAGRETVTDPDLGATKKSPSTQEKLDQSELAIRALKINHIRQQTKMIEEANGMTRHPKADK